MFQPSSDTSQNENSNQGGGPQHDPTEDNEVEDASDIDQLFSQTQQSQSQAVTQIIVLMMTAGNPPHSTPPHTTPVVASVIL